jgi:hypothetical protein
MLKNTDYAALFTPEVPDVSLRDNTMLAQAANDIANAMNTLQTMKAAGSDPAFTRLAEEMVFKFAGEWHRLARE